MTNESSSEIASFRATLDGAEHQVFFQPGKTLLECFLIQGLSPVFSCREGRCGSCMVKVKAGEVRMIRNNVLSPRDIEEDYVLLCQSLPMSTDVWVDCDEW